MGVVVGDVIWLAAVLLWRTGNEGMGGVRMAEKKFPLILNLMTTTKQHQPTPLISQPLLRSHLPSPSPTPSPAQQLCPTYLCTSTPSLSQQQLPCQYQNANTPFPTICTT